MKWFIGCSGYHYRSWKPVFYPEKLPQRLWFEYYCRHFNTLELNTTFYNFPKAAFLEAWHNKSPDGFVFTVKAPRLITHYKKFVEVKSLMDDFYSVISKGLKRKLGPVLFQLPPNLVYSEQKLNQIVNSLDTGFKNVIEFRDKSWWNDTVFEQLKKSTTTFCSISHPTLPGDLIKRGSVVYVRMHGTPRLYTSRYKLATLQNLYEKITAAKSVKEAYVYFNNDVLVAAVKNAMELKEIAGEKILRQTTLFSE